MKRKQFQCIVMSLVLLLFFACSNDDDSNPLPDNEPEEITTVQLIVNDGFADQIFQAGANNNGIPTEIELSANSTYTARISFLNEDENPIEDVTIEINNEAEEHLICYTPTNNLMLTINRTDEDDNGKEIGLATNWQTGAVSGGTLTVSLKHQPDVKADATPENCNLGETDVQVNFNVTIQ